ncbi:MAG: hypothetical protein H6822_01585 [Planctomycetaceae bacterium]|nr:hypothetical protein [Planctomycetales bacterium]MCB9920839.1 hypothetical protein [Planctomycetaceae bacterium]
MKARSLVTAIASFAVLAVTLYAADEIKLDGVKCIMNPKAPAKAEKSVDYKGGKVFFCCDNCPKGFAKKIEAGDKLVAAKGNAQLVQTKQVKQTKCPFSGGPCKGGTDVTVAGAKVYFCCNNCQAKAEKMSGDDQLLAVLGDDAFEKAGFKIKDKE